jgi:SagB-type dehydrogenase family enzyme
MYHTLSSFGWFHNPPPQALGAGSLPPRSTAPDGALEDLCQLLRARRSQRRFASRTIPAALARRILWCGYGLIDPPGDEASATVPSAGGTRSLELLAVTQRVTGLPPALHRYDPETNDVDAMPIALPRSLSAWFRTTQVDYDASALVVLVAVDLTTLSGRYGERGYRYALLEAGHVAQNLCLASTAAGLASVTIGGLDDEVVARAIERITNAVAVNAVVIGQPEPAG